MRHLHHPSSSPHLLRPCRFLIHLVHGRPILCYTPLSLYLLPSPRVQRHRADDVSRRPGGQQFPGGNSESSTTAQPGFLNRTGMGPTRAPGVG